MRSRFPRRSQRDRLGNRALKRGTLRGAATAALLVTALLAAALAVAMPASRAAEPRFGMNRVNLAWLPADARRRVVSEMAASGVSLVRLSLTPPVDASIDAIRAAHERGLRILLEVPLGNRDFYPATARKRPGQGRIWDMYRLSDIDLAAFRAAFRRTLQRIDRLGVALVAVEPGNEINLAAYNGDLAVYPSAEARSPRVLGELQNPAAFEAGLDKYVQLARIVREELAATENSRGAKVISAGLSDMTAALADRRGYERLDAADVVALLETRGIADTIDAFGVHVYPRPGETADALRRQVGAALSFCAATARRTPCWVTEWGLANPERTCPLDDQARTQLAIAMDQLLAAWLRDGRIAAAFYFDWDSGTPYSVWRCGGLTPAGKAVVSSMSR